MNVCKMTVQLDLDGVFVAIFGKVKITQVWNKATTTFWSRTLTTDLIF